MFSYLEQFAEQFRDLGVESFQRLYPWPFLVALGMAGDIQESRSSGTSIINLADSVLERGRISGRVFPLVKSRDSPKGPITIGRTSENDVVIPEYSVSRKHCFIATVAGSYRVTDWGSANGTLVNEIDIGKMAPCPLHGGEIITLGRLMLLFLPPRQFAEHVRAIAPPRDFDR
ncbi:MAG TPA: FHA domain-containing protein [Polyangia bacterium]